MSSFQASFDPFWPPFFVVAQNTPHPSTFIFQKLEENRTLTKKCLLDFLLIFALFAQNPDKKAFFKNPKMSRSNLA
jgi:hypothetical protein